jgi:CRP/FNR family cyclic AMP-dependent transcriptional regulator
MDEEFKTYQPGENVIEEGTKDSTAFIILSGTVRVLKQAKGREIPIGTLGEGQVFGEMGLIEDRPRSATVRALSELKVRCIDREQFNELLRIKPAALIPIMKSLFERIRQVSNLLAEKSIAADPETAKLQALEVIMSGQTSEALKILSHRRLLITKFPFLIGRESLDSESDVFYNNDLFIPETKPYIVSRNHLAVSNENGSIWIIDRGSAFGTIVNGREIGGQTGLFRAPLEQKQNQIVIGPVTSKFIFLLEVQPVQV